MKRLTWVAPAVAAAVGMLAPAAALAEVKASKELLHGSWTGKVIIDEAVLRADDLFKDFPANQTEDLVHLIKQQFGKMTMSMTFNADGAASLAIDGPGIPVRDRLTEGAWEEIKTDGDLITVKITPSGTDDEKRPKVMTFKCLDEKTMTGVPDDARLKMPKGVEFRFTKK